MSARLFRSFKLDQRAARRRLVRQRVRELRAKVQAREPLTDEDHRDLAKMGPNTLRAIGYTPRVTLS